MTTKTKTWAVRYLDVNGNDVREEFAGRRAFMAARQLHSILATRTDITDLEILKPGQAASWER